MADHTDEFILFLSKVNFIDQYGTPESNTIEMDKINNVEQAAEGLRNIIQMPSFISDNIKLFTSKKKYGTLHVWTNQFRKFKFVLD
jgi:hypothetical protein